MKKIIIVDDTEMVRRSAKAVLEIAGYDVAEAENGKIGLQMVGEQTYDLIILDIVMPEVDGFAFLEELGNAEAPPPVIVMSGGGQGVSLEFATAKVLIKGAQNILFKPFDNAELLNAVQDILGEEV